MSRLATSFILGYHGCDESVARKAVAEGVDILQSKQDYDWLGPGAYFWESDPLRALEWARWKATRGDYQRPTVVGAVIDLGSCLDLVGREDVELFCEAYESFKAINEKSGLPMPRNVAPTGTSDADRLLRYLDCAVFRHLHEMIEDARQDDPSIQPFDTIRGMFIEGDKAFPGSGVYRKSHVQIAVRNMRCIKGVFFHRETI